MLREVRQTSVLAGYPASKSYSSGKVLGVVVEDSRLPMLQKQDLMAMVRVRGVLTVQFARVHGQGHLNGCLVRLLSIEVV